MYSSSRPDGVWLTSMARWPVVQLSLVRQTCYPNIRESVGVPLDRVHAYASYSRGKSDCPLGKCSPAVILIGSPRIHVSWNNGAPRCSLRSLDSLLVRISIYQWHARPRPPGPFFSSPFSRSGSSSRSRLDSLFESSAASCRTASFFALALYNRRLLLTLRRSLSAR